MLTVLCRCDLASCCEFQFENDDYDVKRLA